MAGPFRNAETAATNLELQLDVCKWLVVFQRIAKGKSTTVEEIRNPRRDAILSSLPKNPTSAQLRTIQNELAEKITQTKSLPGGDEESGRTRIVRRFKQLKAKLDAKAKEEEEAKETNDARAAEHAADLERHILDAIGELDRLQAELESKRQKLVAASSDAVLMDRLKELETQEDALNKKITQISDEIKAPSADRIKTEQKDATKLKELTEQKDSIEARQKLDLDILARRVQEVEEQVRSMPNCFIGFFRRLWERNGPKDKAGLRSYFRT